MTYNASSTDEFEPIAPDTISLQQEDRKLPTHGQLRAATGNDGIKAFMMNFAASTAKAETDAGNLDVAPATRDFLKASSFLFRK